VLFEATHKHQASQCPLLTSEGKGMLKKLFSEENVKNAGVKIVAGYMSCPKDTGAYHKGFFTMEADNALAVSRFFGQMAVEVWPVQPLSEVAKTL
jgi:hypothetical protein